MSAHSQPVSLKVVFPLPLTGRGIGHTCLSVVRNMHGDDVRCTITVPRANAKCSLPIVRPVLPRLGTMVPYRWIARRALERLESTFLAELVDGDVAYLWSDQSLDFANRLRDRGITVVREKFNCHKATAKAILDDAYARLGLPPTHVLNDENIAKENAVLSLADYVFSPSPLCAASLVDNGVDREKIISSSYGYEPSRIASSGARSLDPIDGLTVLFVGGVCVRKGAHLLLRAWANADIRGRLVLAGPIEPAIETVCADLLARPDVLALGQVEDVGSVFRSADVFAFPTLEEGSPLVSYEAMACSLPMLVSPMGGGAVIRPGIDGIVCDPYDEAGWIDALQTLAADEEERRRLAGAARQRVADYTWQRVGQRRSMEIRKRVQTAPADRAEAGAR